MTKTTKTIDKHAHPEGHAHSEKHIKDGAMSGVSLQTGEPIPGINLAAVPSGTGCVECLATGGWWLHLRRCTECGHIGCCEDSPNQHAHKHSHETGHPIITSFEPGEKWFYSYKTDNSVAFAQNKLQKPYSHPEDQPVPFYTANNPSAKSESADEGWGGDW